jgi:hypothetical protein
MREKGKAVSNSKQASTYKATVRKRVIISSARRSSSAEALGSTSTQLEDKI